MFKKILITAGLLLVSVQASAATLIGGQIDFIGNANITRTGDGSAYTQIAYPFAPVVTIATGSFDATINSVDEVGFLAADAANFFTPWDITAPQAGLWSVGGFTFDLTNVSVNDGTTVGGNGMISYVDNSVYMSTDGYWSFTSQSDGNGTFSFSSTTVPAPGIALLIGLGLVGVGFARKMRKA